MVLNVFRRAITCYRYPFLNKTARFYSIYNPPYLKKTNEIPDYPTLNVQLRGYMYSTLESYQSYINKIAGVLNITVQNGFAFPHKEFHIKRFKSGSIIVDSEYDLKIYERHIQVSGVTSTICPIFIRILEATLPEGVSLCIDEYDPMIQKKRYIPNKELLTLKSELEELTSHKKN